MAVKEKLMLLTSIVTCVLLEAQGADKYTDGNRPYEFGFNIDGEQHRHEKKDEKGLIEGEFGFITADGVYHVTVYATDEQGRFKILSMKNIRVKPYPKRQGHSLELPAARQPIPGRAPTRQPLVPSLQTSTLKPISIEPPARSCSSCSIPTTSTFAPVVPPLNPNQIAGSNPKKVKPETNSLGQQDFGDSLYRNVPNYPALTQNNLPGPEASLSKELVPPQFSQGFRPAPAQSPQVGARRPQSGFDTPQENFSRVSNPGTLSFPQPTPETSPIGHQTTSFGRTPKRLDTDLPVGSIDTQPNYLQRDLPSAQGPLPIKPTLISAQMQIVDKNTDIYRRGPGERDGLPDGLTKDDMTKLLYTFNYTVGFHGHFEEGYVNGAKQGYYFVTSRNGVRTRIDYTADSAGFHPKISQEVLDLLSDDVPKPETEKEEKYGLKGYQFKWLYYPVDKKGL